MTVMERLLNEIEAQGKTQAGLCRHLNIKTSIIAGWKKTNSIPPSWHLVGISEYLGVSIDWLLTGESAKLLQPKNAVSMWELQEYQRQAIEEYFSNLTEDQALLLDNYGKLTLSNQIEIQSIITMKLTMQGMGRAGHESGTA